MSLVSEIDRSVVGEEFDHTVHAAVTAEQIIAYARSYGETNPLYTDEDAARLGPYGGLIAPPTFPIRLRRRQFVPKKLPWSVVSKGFDAGKDLELVNVVRLGDVLTTSSRVHDIYEKTGRSGRMVFIVFRTTVINQGEELVAHIDQRMMFRGDIA